MRNGDYYPTRLDAQTDGVNLVCGSKLREHPESTIGILTTGGAGFVSLALSFSLSFSLSLSPLSVLLTLGVHISACAA